MTTRDEAVAALDAELGSPSRNLTWDDVLDVLATAGLLRPDPTGEDREALIEALDDAGLLMNRVEAPGAEPETYILEVGVDHAVAAILAAGFSRPRGPVTEAPAVTTEQIEAAARALRPSLWESQPFVGDGLDAAIESRRESSRNEYRERARAALEAALGIEVRGGEPA